VGSAAGAIAFFGYPFTIIFGFPAPYSTIASRRVSSLALCVLILTCIASAVATSVHYEISGVLGTLLGLPLVALLFSPFFIATHVLGEARRALRSYKPTDSIGAWFALLYFPFGGVFFLHRTVAAAAASILGERGGGLPHAV